MSLHVILALKSGSNVTSVTYITAGFHLFELSAPAYCEFTTTSNGIEFPQMSYQTAGLWLSFIREIVNRWVWRQYRRIIGAG